MARSVGLHLRYPEGWNGSQPFVDTLRALFSGYQSGITFSVASSAGVPAMLERIDVGACRTAPTPAAAAAFQALVPPGMDDDHVLVLFVSQLDGAQWGCSQCPSGARGVIVLCGAVSLTLAHEIAHLFLGPGHDGSDDNLMFADTSAITRNPPLLLPSQLEALRRAAWQLPAAPELQFVSVAVKRRARTLEPRAAKGTRRRAKTAARHARRRRRTKTQKRKPGNRKARRR